MKKLLFTICLICTLGLFLTSCQHNYEKYQIKFDSNGGSYVESIIGEKGMNSTLPTPTKEGYVFRGWYLNGKKYTEYTIENQSVTLVAKWVEEGTPIVYFTINFDSAEGNEIKAIEAEENEEVTLPTPIRQGYKFDGWYLEDVKMEKTIVLTKDINLLAKWIKITYEPTIYTITFDSNEGSEVQPISSVANKKIDLPTPTRLGYRFLGWYNDDQKFEETLMPKENITLVAKWELITYTITFNSNGGSAVDSITDVPNATIKLPTPTKEGFMFVGWYQNDKKFEGTSMPEENITLNAKWDIIKYTITFNSKGGSLVDSITDVPNATLKLPTPTKKGYTFKGWYLDGKKFEDTKIPEQNITLDAQWEIINYTVEYTLNGGTLPEGAPKTWNVEQNDTIVTPLNDKKDFKGWTLNEKLVTKFEVVEGTKIVLVATWVDLATYNITYDFDGGVYKIYSSYEKFVTEFLKDYNNYAQSSITAATFHTSTSSNVKTVFANSEMLTKYKWLFEFIKAEMSANIEASNNQSNVIATEGLELLTKLIAGDTTAINGEYSNGRSVIRHFIHNLLNKDHESVGNTNGGYLDYTTDFAIYDNQTRFFNTIPNQEYQKTYTRVDEVTLIEPTKIGYTFKGWFNEGKQVTKIAKGSKGNITLVAKWELKPYSITYNLAGGKIEKIYPSIDAFATEFVADFSKYGNYQTSISNFHSDSHKKIDGVEYGIKQAFANSEMLTKYKWLFEFIKDEMSANIEATNNQSNVIATEGLELLTKLINGDTTAVGGSYSNGRSVIRHFIHNLLNKDHQSAGNTGGLYLPYTTDFSLKSNQDKFYSVIPSADVKEEYTINDSITLYTPFKEGYIFTGWFVGSKEIKSIAKGSYGNITLVAKWQKANIEITYDLNGGKLLNGYTSSDAIGAAFLADFNKYANTNIAAANFQSSTGSSIKDGLKNAEMLKKWSWLFKIMYNHLSEYSKTSKTNSYISDALPSIKKLYEEDTSIISSGTANFRTLIRHYLHGLMNNTQGNPNYTSQSGYANETPNFANATEQNYVLNNQILRYSSLNYGDDLPTLVKDGYTFKGWNDPTGKLTTKVTGSGKYTAVFEAK